MNTKTIQADVTVADASVVRMLATATKGAVTAQQTARDAAKLAFKSPAFTSAANRYEQLLSLYRPNLENEVVRQAFSNALAVLTAGDDVRIACTAKTENLKSGALAFAKPEVLSKGEHASDAEKSIVTVSASDAVDKLSKAELQAASKIARAKIGGGRAEGAGRKAGGKGNATPDHNKRAGFADEFAALMGDVGGRTVIAKLLQQHGYKMVAMEATKKMAKEAKADKEAQALDIAPPSEVAALVASMAH